MIARLMPSDDSAPHPLGYYRGVLRIPHSSLKPRNLCPGLFSALCASAGTEPRRPLDRRYAAPHSHYGAVRSGHCPGSKRRPRPPLVAAGPDDISCLCSFLDVPPDKAIRGARDSSPSGLVSEAKSEAEIFLLDQDSNGQA